MRLSIAVAALLPLAACNSQPTVSATNATAAEVGGKVAEANADGKLMTPGRWEGSVAIRDVSVPGLPAAQQQMIAEKMGAAHPVTTCVTAEDMKKNRAFFAGEEMAGCTYENFSMAGGKLSAKVKCDRPDAKVDAAMSGTYSSDTYHLEMKTTASREGLPQGKMMSTIVVDSKRTGECRGDEKGA